VQQQRLRDLVHRVDEREHPVAAVHEGLAVAPPDAGALEGDRVGALRGSVEITGGPDAGTTVRITLPDA